MDEHKQGGVLVRNAGHVRNAHLRILHDLALRVSCALNFTLQYSRKQVTDCDSNISGFPSSEVRSENVHVRIRAEDQLRSAQAAVLDYTAHIHNYVRTWRSQIPHWTRHLLHRVAAVDLRWSCMLFGRHCPTRDPSEGRLDRTPSLHRTLDNVPNPASVIDVEATTTRGPC